MKVGFVGLGDQGLPMAQRLWHAGHELTVWARRSASVEPFSGTGVAVAGSLGELGAAAEMVGVCVFDAAGVQEVVLGAGGVAAAMAPGGVIVVHSTVAPAEVVGLADALTPLGLHVVDAPVSGGRTAAEDGSLTVMLGGDETVVDRISPVVGAYGGHVARVGEVGAGQRAKIVNNALIAAHMHLATEALDLGERVDLDRDALLAILRSSTGRSHALDVIAAGRTLETMARSATRATIGKDVALATELFGPGPEGGVIDVARRWCEALEREAAQGDAPSS